MENTLFKNLIKYVDYEPILFGLDMMMPPDRIEQVKAEIMKFSERINNKCKVPAVQNSSMTLGYMELVSMATHVLITLPDNFYWRRL